MVGILENDGACFRRTQGAGNVPMAKSDTSIASSASTNESSSSESASSINASEGVLSASEPTRSEHGAQTVQTEQTVQTVQTEQTERIEPDPLPQHTIPVKDAGEVSSTSSSTPSAKTATASTSSSKDAESSNDASLLRRSVSESAASKSSSSEQSVEKYGTSTDDDDGASNAFPSLPHSVLRQLGLLVRSDRESFSDSDIETRFISLALAFKTDVLTLSSRLEIQKRQRDQAEINMATEATTLKNSLYNLSRVYIDSDCVEALAQIQLQVDILQQASHRVSGSAELFGAVQQEHRLSRATEVLVAHVDNTKLTLEKMNGQLEELKRVLAENNIVMEDNADGNDPAPRTLRYRSLAAITAKKLNAKRRASIAALPRPVAASLEAGRSLSNLLEPKPKSHMANIVNSMRMKSTLSTITALASSTVDISEWPEKAVEGVKNETGESYDTRNEIATADSPLSESEVNNNDKDVDENEQEALPEECLPVLTPSWRESRHSRDEVLYEEVNPLQYLRDGCQRIVLDYKQAALTYVQRNKTELLKKIRLYISSALFAAAGWFLIWIIIPTSDAAPQMPQIRIW